MGASGSSSTATFDAAHPFCVQAAPDSSGNAATPPAIPTVYCRGKTQAEAMATATAAHSMCVSFNTPATTGITTDTPATTTDGAYTCPLFTRFDNKSGPNLAPIDLGDLSTIKGVLPLAGLALSTQYVDIGTSDAKPMSIYPVGTDMQCSGKAGTVNAMPMTFGKAKFCNIQPTKKKAA
jgi:hypothetical protein